jgi:hypothetical protein
MKFKIVLFLSVFFLLMLFYSCVNVGSTPDGEKSDGDLNLYLITTNGSLNSLSQNAIDAEYNTFFFLPGETRKIYLGGKLPVNNSNYTSLWLENSIIWNPRQVEGIFSTDINSNNYYSIPIAPRDLPAQSGDYNVYARVGLESGVTYTPYSTKNLTFKVSPNYEDRDWGLRVYQQQSYNVLNITKVEIVNAFNNMHVYLAPLGNENIIDVNHSLSAETINWDRTKPFETNELIVYAYQKVYPNITNTNLAMATYASDFPNEGLLFYIKDYNIINGTAENLNGVTFASGVTVARLPVVSFVFVKRIRDNFASDWEDKAISAVSIHELGHLWCDEFTDNATHSLWHNGDNKNQCIMINPYVVDQNGDPDDMTKNILTYLGFCEGHLQRGMNVSWVLKQYAPFGEKASGSNQSIFTFNGDIKALNNIQSENKLDVKIESDKKDFVKGKFINVLVKVKNISADTIKLSFPEQHLYSYEESKTINYYPSSTDLPFIAIPPFQEYIYSIDPLMFINHKKEDRGLLPGLPWYYWPVGEYDYYITYKINNVEYNSNRIPINIKPVPDSLIIAFEDLKDDINNPPILNPLTYRTDKYESLFEKYKGTFYEKEFLYKLLTNWNYTNAIYNKEEAKILRSRALELYKKFILKYPNTSEAYDLFSNLVGNYNENNELVAEILDNLRTNNPKSKLLETLANQPEYMNKQIKHLLK